VAQENTVLSIEERNLLSVAFKNYVGSRRTAWRALSALSDKEMQKKSQNYNDLMEYKKKIENELQKTCDDVIGVIEEHILPNVEGDKFEGIVF
jgi:14-3-3 protein epsilon